MEKKVDALTAIGKLIPNGRMKNGAYKFETLAQMYEYDKTVGIVNGYAIYINAPEEDDQFKLNDKFYPLKAKATDLQYTPLNDGMENNTYKFKTLAQMYKYDEEFGIEDRTYIIITNMEEDDKVKIGGKFYTPDPEIIDLQSMSLKKITNSLWLNSLNDQEKASTILELSHYCQDHFKFVHESIAYIVSWLQSEHKE